MTHGRQGFAAVAAVWRAVDALLLPIGARWSLSLGVGDGVKPAYFTLHIQAASGELGSVTFDVARVVAAGHRLIGAPRP